MQKIVVALLACFFSLSASQLLAAVLPPDDEQGCGFQSFSNNVCVCKVEDLRDPFAGWISVYMTGSTPITSTAQCKQVCEEFCHPTFHPNKPKSLK